MLALSCVVIAGLVGAGGLGAVVVRGISTLDVGAGFQGGLSGGVPRHLPRLAHQRAGHPAPLPQQDPQRCPRLGTTAEQAADEPALAVRPDRRPRCPIPVLDKGVN